MMRRFLLIAGLVSLLAYVPVMNCLAENSALTNTNENENSLDDLSWLVGHWQANAFGGICEEVWSPPSSGSMTGTFKLAVNGEISFYEIIILTIEDGGPTMRLKHFNSDLTGWEEKSDMITFPFVKLTDKKLQLEGITYSSSSFDSLQIDMNIRNAEGKIDRHIFNFWRISKD